MSLYHAVNLKLLLVAGVFMSQKFYEHTCTFWASLKFAGKLPVNPLLSWHVFT